MTANPPLVAVLLCTYQGEGFLAAQLNSIATQTHLRWKIWASDDGSADRTTAILEHYKTRWGVELLTVLRGPRRGFVANFMSLICRADIAAEHYAYADQDDVWESDKLARAVAWLETAPPGMPALYMSRTRLIDEDDVELGFAPLFTAKPPSFANAVVQNIGGGNTMVINQVARDLIISSNPGTAIVSHDWWSYILVTGAGGCAFYDSYPSVRYRQHRANVVGSNAGLLASIWRAFLVFKGRFKSWGDLNTKAIAQIRERLTPDNRRIFDDFAIARSGSLPVRLLALKRSGVHRQGFVDNIGLYVAALFNRL
jgi:glycosyltransferase involved in cell wall biosynthesis